MNNKEEQINNNNNKQNKKEEIAIMRKLLRTKGWNCTFCQQFSNDARRVCGNCLNIEPGVIQEFNHNNNNENNNNNNNKELIHACSGPGFSLDPTVSVISLSHSRCYRINNNNNYNNKSNNNNNNETRSRSSSNDSRIINTSDNPLESTSLVTRNIKIQKEEENNNNNNNNNKEETTKKLTKKPETQFPHKRKSYTHFISIPIGKLPEVKPNAITLLEEIKLKSLNKSTKVTEDIFTTAPRLHFTLLMLTLSTPASVQFAIERMQVLQEEIKEWKKSLNNNTNNNNNNKTPQIHLAGLHAMHGRGRNHNNNNNNNNNSNNNIYTDVVYMGLADEVSRNIITSLQKIVHKCFAEFLIDDPRAMEESKLLHMTIINSKWRNSENNNSNILNNEEVKEHSQLINNNNNNSLGKKHSRVSFDARDILREFANVKLCGNGENGAVHLKYLELNALGYDTLTECYPCEFSIQL